MVNKLNCRACNSNKIYQAVDLGNLPVANELVLKKTLNTNTYPLNLLICENCFLGQVGTVLPEERIFRDYRYLSSMSNDFLDHAKDYSNKIITQRNLNKNDLIIEIACNDGYLLKNFVSEKYRILGIEPARNVAKIAEQQNIPVINEFFGSELAYEVVKNYGNPKLVIANNVLAHVPDINDFMLGLSILANEDTFISIENPSLFNLHKNNQFDTIYHEHYSYLSANSVNYLCNKFDLYLNEIDKLPIHGGSNRYWISKNKNLSVPKKLTIIEEELEYGLYSKYKWENFVFKIDEIKKSVKYFINNEIRLEKKICGYGAAAKASTVLNYFDIDASELIVIADKSHEKMNRYMPLKNFPIVDLEYLVKMKPDHVIVFPWNIKNEIKNILRYKLGSEVKLWVVIPEFRQL